MFTTAIETAEKFTRPLHIVSRPYGSSTPTAGAATLILINDEGWALTCKHVATEIAAIGAVQANYDAFKARLASRPAGKSESEWLQETEAAFNMKPGQTVQALATFVNCVDTNTDIEVRVHPTLDVALIRFRGFNKVLCSEYPVFAADPEALKPGKSICRMGYPFPEFTNFEYDVPADQLRWTSSGRTDTPFFPIEGMVTRRVGANAHAVVGFEVSTPGLRGQSGGPAFDTKGIIWGMQSSTGHHDLNFDVDMKVMRNGLETQVKDSAFLHVGRCVHVSALKDFMRSNGVKFREEPSATASAA